MKKGAVVNYVDKNSIPKNILITVDLDYINSYADLENVIWDEIYRIEHNDEFHFNSLRIKNVE